ncbi:glycosyltransferase family 4 protein [Thermodesulfobacteriota bacterium]
MTDTRKNRLRVAVLVKRFVTSGGSERYAVEVARQLADKGHTIDLYAREFDTTASASMKRCPVPDRLRFSSVLNLASFAFDAKRMLHGKTYDIVHSHERGYGQDVSTLHTFSYRGSLQKYAFLRKIDQVYLSPRSRIHLWLEQKQMRTPRLVAVSDVIKADTRKYYHRDKGVSVISPGVDTTWFHSSWIAENRDRVRQEEKIPDNEMVVLFVGTEFQRKGLDRLIPAITPGMQLVVVGKGEREGHYRRMVHKCGAADRVTFKGLSDDVRRYMAGADVIVLPSIKEAFGMSILEGMACGLPVVTSADAGVSTLINTGVNGFVFEDPSDLHGILLHLFDPAERRSIGARARKTAEKHTWHSVAEAYEELYYDIADEKQSL